MKRFIPVIALLLVVAAATLGTLLWKFRGAGPALRPTPGDIADMIDAASSVSSQALLPGENNTPMPLKLPDGFAVDVFARDLPGARVLVQDGLGNFWVSRPSAGTVTQLEMSGGTIVRHHDIFRNLRKPHGLAVDNSGMTLYIAEETSIKRVPLYSDATPETIATLPAGGRHTSRTIVFAPDERLYVSIGSTCDACIEENELYGTIVSMKTDGSDRKIVARGLRNAVFFDWSYIDGSMWATEMGRDMLGDTTPPDEVNIITEGSHYGWPYCYGDQVRDTAVAGTFDCATSIPPRVELGAHVAPLGLAFVPEEGWPEEWWYDLLVAQHGSWNSATPVGYNIIRIPLDAQGNAEGEPVDFMSGWLESGRALGRPVDLMIQPGGTLYITDDKAGVVYRLARMNNE